MIGQEFLIELTESYLKSVFRSISSALDEDFDIFVSFKELGIDSFYVLKIVKKLEDDFGTLPKTLLFENFNISDLANYFVNKHSPRLLTLFSSQLNSGEGQASGTSPALRLPKAELEDNPESVPPVAKVPQSPSSAAQAPFLILEKNAARYTELDKAIKYVFERYKNEGSVSRGTRNIAPNLFIGSEKKGFFNYARCNNIILAYAYTGPREYFITLVKELYDHCEKHHFELNIFAVEQLKFAENIPFSATPFGVFQRILNIRDFSLDGKKMRRLRYQVAKFESAGECRTMEYQCGSKTETDKAIANIIDQWCEARTMVNPLIYIVKEEILAGTLSQQHRLFLTYMNDVLQNVILISQMSQEENGYLMDLEFYPPTMPLGGLEFAIVKIIETLVAEGCNMLSLGGTYGCKLDPSSNADPHVDKILDDLRMQNIFNDEGNLQFKNKFRPENKTIYLCRPEGKNHPDNVIDIIMMIADPAKLQTSDEEFHTPLKTPTPEILSVKRADSSREARSRQTPGLAGSDYNELECAGFNPINIPADNVSFDLKTDSWAQLSLPAIDSRTKSLYSTLQQPVNLDESLRTIFPFDYFALTQSGRSAEKALCRAWQGKGTVLQNLLFPTWIFSQIEEGFTPLELPHPQVFQLQSNEIYKGNLDWDALHAQVTASPGSIAFVCIELSDNAAGGCSVAIDHIRQVKTLLEKHAIPLVMDATRILENALFIIHQEEQFAKQSIWQVTRAILSLADVVTVSLAKDFCLHKGGLIATNDAELFQRVQECIQEDGAGLDVIDKKLVAHALQQKKYIETQIKNRVKAVKLIGKSLKQQGVPIVEPLGGHCLVIDVKQIPEFAGFAYPTASFLAWLFLSTGIRAGEHNVGMQKDSALNGLVRLAIPVGLEQAKVIEIITQLTQAFNKKQNIPEILPEGNAAESFGDIHRRFSLKEFHSLTKAAVKEKPSRVTATKEDRSAQVAVEFQKAALLPTDFNSNSERFRKQHKDQAAGDCGPKIPHKLIDVAIVGMAGRYPKATNMDEMWENLKQGRDCIDDLPEARTAQRLQGTFNQKYRGGFLQDIDKFDSLFFNISPREAEVLDPQERLFLEVAWEALEDAGYYPEILEPRNVGVYVGAVWAMYQMVGVEQKLTGNIVNPNSFLWSIANRVSYWMNLTGPSMTVDTACSSSLTAIYLACEAIAKGDCCGAIVGGVNLDLHQHKFDINWAGGALSSDGVCRSFGAGANGYVAGEGVGAIYLKPLEQAINDRDNIYGVIKSIVVNHGGKTSGYTVPNPKAQSSLITAALEKANIDGRSLGYIEAHGTGTELGDPIEISGLTTAFEKFQVEVQSCPIGSVKTNIGHLEAAAGIVGVCKVLLQMKHRQIVPSLHSAELNAFIDFQDSPFYVEQTLENWQEKQIDGVTYPLRAGVSSFGAGGANAHVILEHYHRSAVATEAPVGSENLVFPLSAKNDEQLLQVAQRLLQHLARSTSVKPPQDIHDIAFTLQNGRKSFECRAVIIARDSKSLADKLDRFVAGIKDADIIVGHAKNAEGITRLLNRKEKAEFINLLCQSRDPHRLAQLWIDGLLSDWQGFPLQRNGNRVSLPTYPFADKRHWIVKPGSQQDAAINANDLVGRRLALHPLIDSNESTFQRQVFKKSFNDREFFIHDHIVSGIATLPGVAYLEQVRLAGEIAAGRKIQKIKNILWVNPLTVENSLSTDVSIELKPAGDSVNFEIFSENRDGKKTLYSQGKLLYSPQTQGDVEPEYLDIASIRARCVKAIDGEEAYSLFNAAGLNYGSSFQLLQEVFKNEEEVLGLLKLPEMRVGDFDVFQLHPSILDASMQAGVAAQLKEVAGEMIVPYSIGEVELFYPLTQTCYSYVTKVSGDKKTGVKLSRENVIITDETGKILARIRESIGVPLVEVHEKSKQQSMRAGNLPAEDEYTRLYYSHTWEKSRFDSKINIQDASDSLLIFDNDDELRNAYLARLPVGKHSTNIAILIKPGDKFLQLNENTFQLNPRDAQEFKQLFKVLKEAGVAIEKICYAWSANTVAAEGGELSSEDELREAIEIGPLSFLFFNQALIEQKLQNKIQLVYLHFSSEDNIHPHNEAMNGFVKTLQLENPKIHAKTLDMDEQTISNNVIQALLTEFHPEAQNAAVRYQGSTRYVRSLCKYELDDLTQDHSLTQSGLKQSGVYLITGGAGGLGMVFAEFLVNTCKAKLLLTGRSQPSAEIEAKIHEWRQAGAEAIYIPADISSYSDVQQLVDEVKSRFGQINGVIHSAGVLRDSYIRNKTRAEMEAVFAPKVFGTFYLDQATRDEDLDFFVTFSSLAAVGGNAGQCDYAYANHYMDSLVAQREIQRARGERSGKSLSLNWSLWADGGMKLDEQTDIFFRKNLGIKPLSKAAGLDAFVSSLSADKVHLAVLEAVQDKIEQAWGIRKKELAAPIALAPAPTVTDDKVTDNRVPDDGRQLSDLLVKDLSQLVITMLKLDSSDLSLDDILLDLGFDSIGLTTFANAINDKYQIDINPVLFFEYPSINTIAEHISVEYRAEILKIHRPASAAKAHTKPEVAKLSIPPLTTSDVDTGAILAINKSWNYDGVDQVSRQLTAPANSLSRTNRFIDEPIAIVGIAGVMPQSANLQEFWDNLNNARNLVTDIPRDRWIWEEHHGDPIKEVNKSNSRWGGFMKEVDKFDPFFFGIIPREAEMMDPQQRIFLETVWHAVEDSGHKVSDLSGTKTGVFVGVSAKDYIDVLAEHQMALDGFSASGNSHSILANRVSFLLNLRGPSAPLDTACSSSLVALHRAIESIHTGSSDMAIVGGVQVMLTPVAHISLSSAGMLSVDGKCKTFDKDANGYVRGEGSGAIFIKPLAKAEADANPIYAVIKATAENHGGKVTMLTAPNPNAQTELLLDAYGKAQIDPSTLGYIECHGTGTSLGDPIEIQALKRSFAELYKKYNKNPAQVPHCGLSSVKTNIGHLEPAAGIASLLKVLLAIKHQRIPALLHFSELNPYIDLANSPFYIVDKTRSWDAMTDEKGNTLPRRAGVSSFGWGGANAHIVLEEYIPRERQFAAQQPRLFPIVLSAKNGDSLKAYAKVMLTHLQQHEVELADLAHTLQVGRDAMEERLGLVVDSLDQLKEKLRTYIKSNYLPDGVFHGRVARYKRNERGLSVIDEEHEGDEDHIEQWIAEENLEKLLSAWVKGSDVEWCKLHSFDNQDLIKPVRISLPGYPFARERYWIDNSSKKKDVNTAATRVLLHPLLQHNISVLNQIRFSSVFSGKESFLLPHPSNQSGLKKLLSPMAYLEMAREGVVQATMNSQAPHTLALELRNVEWGQLPVVTGGQPVTEGKQPEGKQLVTRIFKSNHHFIGYQTYSVELNDEGFEEEVMHCRGEALLNLPTESLQFDIQQLKAQMRRGEVEQDRLDMLYDNISPRRDTSFKGIQAIFNGHEQLLAQLRLPNAITRSDSEYILHPAIMDSCLQAASLLVNPSLINQRHESPEKILPTHLGTLKIFSSCTASMHAWVRFARASHAMDKTLKLDIDLLDSSGKVCVRLQSLCFNNYQAMLREEENSVLKAKDFEQLLNNVYLDAIAEKLNESEINNGEFEKILEEIF